MDYTAILASFGLAFVTVALGYFKTTKPEDFDPVKLLYTLLLGAAVGTVVSFLNIPLTNALAYLGEAGITVWLYWFAQGINKYVKGIKKA